MAKQTELQDMDIVDVRLKIPRYKRDKLKLLSVIEKSSMNCLLEKAIDDMITDSEVLKTLTLNDGEKKKRISLMGIAKGGQPITKEEIDEVIQEWNRIGSQ